jgi:DNA repair protein RecN (Recombination protein N)
MLTELVVEGLGVIEHTEMGIEAGSTALTGETGAGKTLVVAAVGLLLGGRSDRTLIRRGATEARIEGRFAVPSDHPAATVLVEQGLVEIEDAREAMDVVLTRRIPAGSGTGRARVNGRLVPMAFLAELGRSLVEIAGQHEHQRIGAPSHQRSLLDAYAGPETQRLASEVSAAVRLAAAAARTAQELQVDESAQKRDADLLRHEIDEITRAAITSGESARLIQDARRLEYAESLATGLGEAVGVLRREDGVEDLLGAAEGRIKELSSMDPVLEGLTKRLESARHDIVDVATELAARVIEPDPEGLAATRGRLDQLSKLHRRYANDAQGDLDQQVLDYLTRSEAKVDALDSGEDEAHRWRVEHARQLERAQTLAIELTAQREAAAPRMSQEVSKHLASLALEGARIEVALQPRDLYEGGAETVSFLFSANPGEEMRHLSRVASGGELSRVCLALHLVAGPGSVRTMIFDEVDAGVGGEAARMVGRSLAQLGKSPDLQVLVVTHLPQVAAFADRHFCVTKTIAGGRTHAEVKLVTEGSRVEELSRMLAGLPGTGTAKDHAKELLDFATNEVTL